MDNKSFRNFLNSYLEVWKNSSLTDLKKIISKDYKAREISGGEIVDFGYEESLTGWEQGFNFAKQEGNRWDLNEVAIFPLRENEVMAILAATLVIGGKTSDSVSLFFQTFKKQENDNWKLIRSYIETGVTYENIKKYSFKIYRKGWFCCTSKIKFGTFAINVDKPSQVDKTIEAVRSIGGKIISEPNDGKGD